MEYAFLETSPEMMKIGVLTDVILNWTVEMAFADSSPRKYFKLVTVQP